MRNETLMAQPFDANKLRLTGEAISIAEAVSFNGGLGLGSFSVSENGVLAYRSGSGQVNQPLWFDRAGKQIGSLGTAGLYFTLWLSPDEKRAAVDRMDSQIGTQDIWLFDLLRGIPSRFTTDPANDWFPVWAPDGNNIIFSSNREGITNLYLKNASGVSGEEMLLKSPESKIETIGRLTERSSYTSLEIHRLSWIFGYSRCLATGSHFPSCKRLSTNSRLNSPLTENGLPTPRMSRELPKFMSKRSRHPVASGGYRRTAGLSPSGDEMEKSSFTLPLIKN